jgi:hypothetical protein
MKICLVILVVAVAIFACGCQPKEDPRLAACQERVKNLSQVHTEMAIKLDQCVERVMGMEEDQKIDRHDPRSFGL